LAQLRYISDCVGLSRFYLRGHFDNLESIVKFTHEDLGKIQGINNIETMIELQEMKRTYFYVELSNITHIKLPHIIDIDLSTIDYRLIIELQKNARASLKELAHVVGVSQMTVHHHIKNLLNSQIIELTAIPNYTKLGMTEIAYARLETRPDLAKQVAVSCAKFPQILTVLVTSGPTNLFITMYGRSNQQIADFISGELSKINGIIKIESFAFIKILKTNFTWISEDACLYED
jgi:DNA-binding Lrp family transcriptional regulator